jgi:hypothetical protein
MSGVVAWFGGVIAFVTIVAVMSRLLTLKQFPQYITNASNALANLFKGAFGQ